ncbi:MAG: cell division protein FtsH, partial [Prevotellaceae bacterium]|nr:cell division protein FtsH [Prevotellaceae bacterium]
NAAKHNELADLLCEHEVIFAADVTNIFGPRPWKSRAEIIMEEQPPVHQETPADASLTSAEPMTPTADSATETARSVEESGNTPETSGTSSSHPVDAPFSPN